MCRKKNSFGLGKFDEIVRKKKDEFELNYSAKNPKCSFGSWDKGFSRIFFRYLWNIFLYVSLKERDGAFEIPIEWLDP